VSPTEMSTGPTITIAGPLGELLASVWYQGALRSMVQVSPLEIRKSRGHGLELSRDRDGSWLLVAVNHPWTHPPTHTVEIARSAMRSESDHGGLLYEAIPDDVLAVKDVFGHVHRRDPDLAYRSVEWGTDDQWACQEPGCGEWSGTDGLLDRGAPLTVVERQPPPPEPGEPLPLPWPTVRED